MKKAAIFITFLIASVFLCSCGENPSSSDENNQLIIPDGYMKTEVSDISSGINIYGTSVEFDPHFLSQNLAKGLVKEEDWQIIENRVEKMGIDRFRVMILPSWLEPFNDNNDSETLDLTKLTPQSSEMKSLYKVLDLAEKNGIDVNLTLWGAEKNATLLDIDTNMALKADGGHFLAKNNSAPNWAIGTLYPEEFAENFSAYIQVLKAKGYTCVKEITPCNEPDWSYQVNGKSGSFEDYKKLCLAVDKRFKADGIRQDVAFNLSDNTDRAVSWLENTMNELDSITDIYNSHTYIFGYSTPNSTITDWEEENRNITRNTGKPHVIGEFGSNLAVGSSRQSDIDEYRRGVLIIRQMLNYYNVGASGTSYWTLFDQYYSTTDPYESMMQLGLWKSSKASYYSDSTYYANIKEDYEVRPQYYAFSLFSKYVPKGAQVFSISLQNDFALGSAFKDNSGKWTYVFANGNETGAPLKISLQNGQNYATFKKYVYEENSLPTDDSLIENSGEEKVRGQVLSFELSPQTVMVFKQI